MDNTLHVILQEMRTGFETVNKRLDQINGTVRRHSEQLAVIESQGLDDRLDEMSEQFIAHRARCPFDAGVVPGSAVTANDDAVLLLSRRIKRNQGLAAASLGGAVVLTLIELLPRIADWFMR